MAGSPTGADLERARAFIASRLWQFARTMPWNPHTYTVREWACDGTKAPASDADLAEFDWFVSLIYRSGWVGQWGRDEWPYLDVDGHSYFTFGHQPPATTLINRKPVDKVAGDRDTPPWGDRPPVR